MFDTELFINEVSIRPPLWDLKLKDYSNRDLKSKLWIEVARIVLSNWEQMTNEEKNKEVKELQKKWRSLRDCFAREKKNLKLPSGSSQKKKKKYVYFDQLLFLTANNTDRRTTTNVPDEQPDIRNENAATEENNEDLTEVVASEPATPNQVAPNQAAPNRINKKYRQTPFEMAVLKHLTNASKPTDEEEEADKHFLLSFLPMLKNLPVDKKLWVRMKFTEVMQQALAVERYNPPPAFFAHSSHQWQQLPNVPNHPQYNYPNWTDASPRERQANIQSPTPSESLSNNNSDVFSVFEEL
ncbi:hypothetical protein J6590_092352 [Homalodisca vitripennis]|nr:hypothetical protein J6590_092352 [Homalodisca vitripennis]